MSTFGIAGVQSGRGGDGSVPLRLEIRQLQQNADQWNLYLLALDRLQSVNQPDQLSWYQISGIHGRPYVPWDNVQATPGEEQSGYCTHSSILFPTWHRPYLVLYEQVLYNIMQQIVGEFPAGSDRDRYSAAASTFRIPYWDWAAAPPSGQSVLPASVGGSATVQVTAPNGTTTIKNPLFSYTFHPLDPNELPDSPFNMWPSTLRYPTSSSDPKATSQNDLVSQQLDNNRLSFRNRLYNLFTAYPNYANFSNKAWIPNGDGGNYDSIESVHDQIHGLVGSGGHMSIVDYSAFDPIFYLHHCNVDRAFAIWQAIYPESYVEPERTQFGTFTNAPGSTEDVNTALTPFHTDGGDFWNSGTARNTSTFGYSYPELQYWKASSPSQYQADVRAAVNNLYGNSAPAAVARRAPKNEKIHQALKSRLIPAGGLDGPSDEKPSIMVREQAVDPTRQENAGHSTSKDGKYREWIANIRVKKYALDTSFFIHVFLGDFNPDPFKWSFEPNLVGTHCIFVNDPNSTHCGKCKRDQANDLQVTGAIPLTTALLAAINAGSLASLDPADVEPYLKTNLHWRVTRMDDTAVPTDQVPDLKVSVVSSVVQKATSPNDFPRWGDFIVHDDVTDTRPGGLNRSHSVRSKRGDGSTASSAPEKSAPKHRFTMASLRGIQQPELSKKLFKIIKSENHCIGSYETAGRERISIASQLSDWGEATGDDSISDISDKLGVLLSELGEQEDVFAQNLEDYRGVLKQIRNTESSVQPSRDHKGKIADEIQKLKYKEPQSPKILQLEQELVRAEAQNLVAEAQLTNITRQKLKEAYDMHFAATIERAEKQALLARHGRRLLNLLDDTPIVPGDARPAFDHADHARQILNDAEEDLRTWQPSLEPISTAAGELGPGLMPSSTGTGAPSSVEAPSSVGAPEPPVHAREPHEIPVQQYLSSEAHYHEPAMSGKRDASGSTVVDQPPYGSEAGHSTVSYQ